MATITETRTLDVFSCGECGVVFALDADFVKARRRDHRTWYCPNGHQRHWPEHNREEQLRAQLDQMQADRDNQKRLREMAEAARNAAEAATKAAKTRATRGMCPVPGCRRSFVNVKRHVEGQHPDFHHQHS